MKSLIAVVLLFVSSSVFAETNLFVFTIHITPIFDSGYGLTFKPRQKPTTEEFLAAEADAKLLGKIAASSSTLKRKILDNSVMLARVIAKKHNTTENFDFVESALYSGFSTEPHLSTISLWKQAYTNEYLKLL